MKKFTPHKRIELYCSKKEIFKNVKEFENYLKEKNTAPDYVTIDNILYTMEEFDEAGRTLFYANRRADLSLCVETSDRYHAGYTDAEVLEPWTAGMWRNGFIYAD